MDKHRKSPKTFKELFVKKIMEKKVSVIFLMILIVVVLAVAVYFTFYFTYKCDTKECFTSKQALCKRASYVNKVDDITWFYEIKGKAKNNCEINVKILNVNEGSIDQEKLEKKEMECSLKVGDTSSPESDIDSCHGLLKEDLQGMIIKNLHQYVLDNLGDINEDLKSI